MSESARVNGADEMRRGEENSGSVSYVPPRVAQLVRPSHRQELTPEQQRMALDRVGDPWDWRTPIRWWKPQNYWAIIRDLADGDVVAR